MRIFQKFLEEMELESGEHSLEAKPGREMRGRFQLGARSCSYLKMSSNFGGSVLNFPFLNFKRFEKGIKCILGFYSDTISIKVLDAL